MSPDVPDYPAPAADEAVEQGGRLRGGYAALGPVLGRLGASGLTAAATAIAEERARRGLTVSGWEDGRLRPQPFPQDPWPRIVPTAEWNRIAAGVEQRHRALTAFLADAYRAAGRRRMVPMKRPDADDI